VAPRIDFYHDAQDKLVVAARIAQKACAAGQRLLVVAPEPAVRDAFDRVLWTFQPLSFVPHCRAGHRLEAETPVVLADQVCDPAGEKPDVLINLGVEVPAGFERFDRLIEIVAQDEEDRQPARERFRQYRAAGHEVTSHRLGEKS
jgi:DNA polymerase-3 subunit chi